MSLDDFDDDRIEDDLPEDAPLRRRSAAADSGASEESTLTTALLGAALFVGVFGLTYGAMSMELAPLASLPVVTVAASAVEYSITDLAFSSLSSGTGESEHDVEESRHGIDFSSLLVPYDEHAPRAAREIAALCLPRGRVDTVVAPSRAHAAFGVATDYLVCAMSREKERLCDPDSRRLLVDQLMRYRTLRQHMFGIERARDRLLESQGARYAMKMQQQADSIVGEEPARPVVIKNPKIGAELDPRIGAGLQALSREGYLSLGDFRYMGVLAPQEYAPYLDDDSGRPACR